MIRSLILFCTFLKVLAVKVPSETIDSVNSSVIDFPKSSRLPLNSTCAVILCMQRAECGNRKVCDFAYRCLSEAFQRAHWQGADQVEGCGREALESIKDTPFGACVIRCVGDWERRKTHNGVSPMSNSTGNFSTIIESTNNDTAISDPKIDDPDWRLKTDFTNFWESRNLLSLNRVNRRSLALQELAPRVHGIAEKTAKLLHEVGKGNFSDPSAVLKSQDEKIFAQLLVHINNLSKDADMRLDQIDSSRVVRKDTLKQIPDKKAFTHWLSEMDSKVDALKQKALKQVNFAEHALMNL